MYNLNHNSRRTDISPAFLAVLVKDGYLQTMPREIDGGRAAAANYRYEPRSRIGVTCVQHGDPWDQVPGTLPRPPELAELRALIEKAMPVR